MHISLLLLLAMLVCFLIVGGLVLFGLSKLNYRRNALSFTGVTTRKLDPEERVAIENYLELSENSQGTIIPSGLGPVSAKLKLTKRSHTVYSLTHAITRYSFSVDDTNQWRFHLDSTEVHLPLLWEQYITNDNDVSLILTESLPLVISLNGHFLKEYPQEIAREQVLEHAHQESFIRREEIEPIELLATRRETPEEHSLTTSRQVPEAIIICLAFFILFLSALAPSLLMPWLIGSSLLLIAVSLWSIYSPASTQQRRIIHSLHGTPKRWELFGESNQDQINNISLGIIDLVYPPYWQPYITQDLGKKTDIDIYLGSHVVRQGDFLSLHDEVRLFPLQPWLRPFIIACGSMLVLLMMVIWVPLEMPLKITTSWLSGAKTIQTSSIDDLDEYQLHVGDSLQISGTGVCHINSLDDNSDRQTDSYTPFDCSKIRWKPLTLQLREESEDTKKARTLIETVKAQITPSSNRNNPGRVNPHLENAIQKSGMVLLDNFSDIVQKTQDLCHVEQDCTRLKNALINLGNTKDWDTLVKRANSGKLNGVNVLLRPVSAESLNNLALTSTAPFFARDIARVTQSLNMPIAGGYVFVSDEGLDLTLNMRPKVSLSDYPAQEQWLEFMNQVNELSHTPFLAQGIITSIDTDSNETKHIVLQNTTDAYSYWRHMIISLLLVLMLVCYSVSSVIAVKRYRRSRKRIENIQRYYDHRMNPSETEASEH